ncbi:TFIIB-type zinc ribbon-containing protein [Amycolatopsis dendrobii]|uniref:Zf-TFIIB domain-containing protein n=1 Tax=Amycolatopsis dendrobii TaxID=2760662 RepID=A0A7W3W1B4_9PSEU|nr:zf-TFIIB domain-containing protein [Amycolatopsis dendrobii]MBB1157028.1 zf-TFIIB domain-containing protein [Amycolatopsis dendrobii]
MICPKCQNMMRTVDKNGVHIEQCDGCRGIFLDRGELEQIAGAESAFYRQQPPPYGRPDSPRPYQGGYSDSPRPYRGGHSDSPRPYRGGHADSPRPYRDGYGDSPRPYGGRRKRSFLENLFD